VGNYLVYGSSVSVNYIEVGKFAKCGVNQMWILKTSKDLLEYIQYRSLSSCNSIKTFDFSTLYTSIPHSKLKDRLRELVQLCFIKKNGQRRYKDLVLGRDRSSTCSCLFWLTTYLLCLVDVFFNKWVQTVLLFSPKCSFIRMRQTSSSANKVHVSLTTTISGFLVSMTFHIISFLLLILWVLTIIVVSLFAGFDTFSHFCS
jgi:uncharacterized membrane protein (DUF485 family)